MIKIKMSKMGLWASSWASGASSGALALTWGLLWGLGAKLASGPPLGLLWASSGPLGLWRQSGANIGTKIGCKCQISPNWAKICQNCSESFKRLQNRPKLAVSARSAQIGPNLLFFIIFYYVLLFRLFLIIFMICYYFCYFPNIFRTIPNNSEQFRTLLNSEHVGFASYGIKFRTIPNNSEHQKN